MTGRQRARVIVIGAGMGGLATAARLAAAGHSVTVLERAPRTGGKVGSIRHDGFVFDTGPSLLTLPAVYRQLFDATGGALDDSVELIAVDPAFTYRFADGATVQVPGADPAAVAAALGGTFGAAAGSRWRSLMARASRVWSLTRGPVLDRPVTGMADLLPLARKVGDIRAVAPLTSLRRLGERTLGEPHLVTLLDRYATYTGSDPRQAPAALMTIPYVESAFGVWHVRGGVHRLAAAIADRVALTGGEIRTATPVAEILTGDGRIRGVRTATGEFLPADVVVVNADARDAYTRLLDPPGQRVAGSQVRRATSRVASFSGFSLLLGLRGRTPGHTHHTVLFPASTDAEFDQLFARWPQPLPDPTIYACTPADPLMHPPEGEAVFVLVNAPRHADHRQGVRPGTLDWRAPGVAEGYAEGLINLMAARGWPVRDRLLWWRWRSPADLADETGAPGGSIYGSASHGPQGAFLRPANRTPISGLYLVGGSTHPGGGLPLVAMSAAIVSRVVRADLAAGVRGAPAPSR